MVCYWVELNTMDWLLKLKLLHDFVDTVVNNIQSSLFSTWKNVVSFAGHCVNVWFMNWPYFLAKVANTQIPNTYFSILTSRDTNLVVFKGYVLYFLVALQSSTRFNYIRR